MKYKLISFYAEPEGGNYYTESARRLTDACGALKIAYHIEQLETARHYRDNCFLKPGYIQRCLNDFNCPLLWIDVDSRLTCNPDLAEYQNCDFAAVKHPQHLPIYSHALFFNTTEMGKKLIDNWVESSKNPRWLSRKLTDHDALAEEFGKMRSQMSFRFLPNSIAEIGLAPAHLVRTKYQF